ncbi:hypothetical protein ZWY2020_012964 [Hordeum vulgare]|nr:hypothetical protein ZWY2020_012964 [Hordeum vulgare]
MGSVAYKIAVFVIGCLIVVGQCRPEHENTYEDGRASATTQVSSLENSKITVKWCLQRDCETKGEPYRDKTRECICCVTQPGATCYHSQDECQKNCPIGRN